MSILVHLKPHLLEFTLSIVQAEIHSWWETGESPFASMLKACGLDRPAEAHPNILTTLTAGPIACRPLPY